MLFRSGFGAITWHGLTINSARWNRLPKEVQDIILEVAKEFEAKTGTVNKENYPKQMDELKAKGAVVRKLPDQVQRDWAQSLAKWPSQMAKELDLNSDDLNSMTERPRAGTSLYSA